jgi:hypothetical protein
MTRSRNVVNNMRVKDFLLVNGSIVGPGASNTPGDVYYVDRNRAGSVSGEGKTWGDAFLTITEAVNAVNSDYSNATEPSGGRNRIIYIAEGYYAESTVTLTASDTKIICIAPGGHDSTVLYGVPVTGTFTGTSTDHALIIEGDNNTIYGLGVVNKSNGLKNCIEVADGALANVFIKCGATLDAADSCLYGINDMGNAFTEIIDCTFTVSCKEAGIRLYSATNNSTQIRINNCTFYGTGTSGILVSAAAHTAWIEDCMFLDDTGDTADNIDVPIRNNSGVSLIVTGCSSKETTGDLVQGAGTSLETDNFQLS